MGQKVMCLLYGAERCDEGSLPGLGWFEDCDDDGHLTPSIIDLYGEFAGYENEPEIPFEAAVDLVGYIFALPHGESWRHKGVADIYDLDVPTAELESCERFAPALAAAKDKYARFAAWCAETQGVELGPGTVWLTATEVA